MTSTQSELVVRKGAQLNSCLRLSQINFVKISANVVSHVDSPVWCFDMKLHSVGWYSAGDTISAFFPLQVNLQHKEEDSRQDLFEIHVVVQVEYQIRQELSDDERTAIPHFVGTAGWMNAWPYLRSEVQQLSSKLGCPPLTVPLLLPGQTTKIPVEEILDDEDE